MTGKGDEPGVLDLIDDAIVHVAGDGTALANRAARELLGTVESEAAFALCFEDGAVRIADLKAKAGRSSNRVPGGLVRHTADGPVRFQCQVSRLPGTPPGFAFVFKPQVTGRFQALTAKVEELRAEVAVRKRTENDLKTALANNEVLLQELRHRVKNNVATMQALLNQQRRRTDSPELRQFIQETSGRLSALFAAQQHIFALERDADIPFSALAAVVVRTVRSTVEGPVIDTRMTDDFVVGGSEANAVGLLLNELLTNAVKHGGDPQRLNVVVEAGADETGRFLIVSDDGPGFSDPERTEGLGSRIVAGLVSQLAGTIERRNNNGAVVKVRMPPRC